MKKYLVLIIMVVAIMVTTKTFSQNSPKEKRFGVGVVHSITFKSAGLVLQAPISNRLSVQALVCPTWDMKVYGLKIMYNLKDSSDAVFKAYYYGIVEYLNYPGERWMNQYLDYVELAAADPNRIKKSETAIRAGIGVGIRVDLQNAFPNFLPIDIYATVELNGTINNLLGMDNPYYKISYIMPRIGMIYKF